jgi:hypothetical protein
LQAAVDNPLFAVIAIAAVFSATYAAITAGFFRKNADKHQRDWEQHATERQQEWEGNVSNRTRRLDQRRASYELHIRAATRVEQLLWHCANESITRDELDTTLRDEVLSKIRDHAAEHAVLQLLGSSAVVEKADDLGKFITLAMRNPTKPKLRDLQDCRRELVALMRDDLELEKAPIRSSRALYGRMDT